MHAILLEYYTILVIMFVSFHLSTLIIYTCTFANLLSPITGEKKVYLSIEKDHLPYYWNSSTSDSYYRRFQTSSVTLLANSAAKTVSAVLCV